MKVIDSFNHQEVQGFKFGSSRFGKPSVYSHVYFIDGLLIDTGHVRMANDILDAINDLPVTKIYITHHHEDHSGNIELLRKYFDCPVYGSQLCSDMMKNPPPISLSQKMTWGQRPAFENIIPVNCSVSTTNHKFEIIDVPGHARDMTGFFSL